MRRSAPLYQFLFLSLSVLPAACGDQAPADYQGEPLAVMQGTLYSQLADPLPAADFVLAWPDASKAQGNEAPIRTFQRVELAAVFPADFKVEFLQPPPDTAYLARPETGASIVGPRFTTAVMLLAKHGATITSTAVNYVVRGPTLAVFDSYMVTYFESDGTLGFRDDQGVVYPLMQGPVTKGYHLMRQDRTYCSNGVDQACLEQAKVFNPAGPSAWDTYNCSMLSEADNAVEVPWTTSITFTIPSGDVPPTLPPYAPCPPSSN